MVFKKVLSGERTQEELRRMQALPLERKVLMTKQRIREWVERWGLDGVYISFSGGKDSTVLLNIAREIYPDIKAVFVDTTLEFPEVRTFALSQDDIEVIRPKLNFKQVVEKYGYPLFSKEISETVYGARKWMRAINAKKPTDGKKMPYSHEAQRIYNTPTLKQVETHKQRNEPGAFFAQKVYGVCGAETLTNYKKKEGQAPPKNRMLEDGSESLIDVSPIDLYNMIRTGDVIEPIRSKMLDGTFVNPYPTNSIYSKEKWQFMLFAPFEISNQCCWAIKKSTGHKYAKETGRKIMTAEMASESKLRASQWLINGCNGFDMKTPKSMPMAFWTEQDVLEYIKENGVEIPSVYGSVVKEDRVFKTTGCERTGCIACGFGIHLEKPSCARLYMIENLSNPKVLDWFLRGGAFNEETGLWQPDNRGLGFWFVYEWVNQNGNLKQPLEFPHRQRYIDEYSTYLTSKYLYEGLKYKVG